MKNAESSSKTGSTKKTPASTKKTAGTGADKEAAKKRFGIKAKTPAPAPRQPRTRQRLSVTVLGNASADTTMFEDPILAELTSQIETPAQFETRTAPSAPSHKPSVAIDVNWPTPVPDAYFEAPAAAEPAPTARPETVTFAKADEGSLWPAAIWPSIEDVVAGANDTDAAPAVTDVPAKKHAQSAARKLRPAAPAPKGKKPAPASKLSAPNATTSPAAAAPLLELPVELGITTETVAESVAPLDIPLDLAPTPPDVAADSPLDISLDRDQVATIDAVRSGASEIPIDRSTPPTGEATPLDLPLDIVTDVQEPSTGPRALDIEVDLSPTPPVADATVPKLPTAKASVATEPKTKTGSRGSRKDFADRIAALVEVVEQAAATESIEADQPDPVAEVLVPTAASATVGRRRNRTTVSAEAAAAPKREVASVPTTPPAERDSAAKQTAEKHAAEKRAADKLAADQRAAEKLAAEKLAAEKLAAEKLAAEKVAAEKRAAEKRAAEKLAAEKLAAEKLAAEERAAEKVAAEKRAAEKRAAEKLAAEKLAEAKRAAEKLAAEKLAAEKRAAEKLAAEKRAAAKQAAEKRAAEERAAEKLAAEKLAEEKRAAEKLAAEKLAEEKRAAEKLAAEKKPAEQRAAETPEARAPKHARNRKAAATPPKATPAARPSSGMASWLTPDEEAASEVAATTGAGAEKFAPSQSAAAPAPATTEASAASDEAYAGWPSIGEFASGTTSNDTADTDAAAVTTDGFQPYRAVYERHLHTGNLAPEVVNNLRDLSAMPNKPRFFSAEVAAAEEEARARHRMESVKEGDGSPIVFEIPAEGGRTVRIVVSSDGGVDPVVSAGIVEQPTSAEQERLEARLAAIEEELRRVESRTTGEDGDLRNARQREIADAVHNALGDRDLAPHFDFTMGNGRFTFQRRTPAEATPER